MDTWMRVTISKKGQWLDFGRDSANTYQISINVFGLVMKKEFRERVACQLNVNDNRGKP